jgi:hypothetical protein
VDFIYVELKGNAPPTATLPVIRPGTRATRLVEHPKADAIRVTADTGFSQPAGTTHDYDQVIVALGDAELSLTVQRAHHDTRRMSRIQLCSTVPQVSAPRAGCSMQAGV